MRNQLQMLGVIIIIIVTMSFITKKSALPPGTIEVKNNFFVDETEVRNVDWLEFSYWTKRIYGDCSNEYLTVFPDTTVWIKEELTEKQRNYLKHHKYSYYPVVGITLEQAELYCKWRSDRVNEMLWIKSGKKIEEVRDFNYDYDELPQVVEYRIPTKEEWLEISKKFNLKVAKRDRETEHLTYSVGNSKVENVIGLNDNVSELTSVNGVAMGGNWKNSNHYNEVKYIGSSNIIGLRCVCDRIIK